MIVEVDGKTPENANVIDGEEGKEISLKVKQEAGEPKEVKITRARISTVRPETLTWAGDDAAVLRIYTFSAGYNRKNVEDLIKQANEKGKYLVLDLRSNGGGAVNNLQHLLSLLLPPDTVLCTDGSVTLASAAHALGVEHQVINVARGIRVRGPWHVQNATPLPAGCAGGCAASRAWPPSISIPTWGRFGCWTASRPQTRCPLLCSAWLGYR